jgi:exportin-1
MEFPEVQQ